MTVSEKYVREGHPSIDELMAEQAITFPRDPHELIGDFWPRDESTEDFLQLLRDSRGRLRTDPAA